MSQKRSKNKLQQKLSKLSPNSLKFELHNMHHIMMKRTLIENQDI